MSLYSMRSHDGGYSITKFDSDLNPLDTYQVSEEACTCPAGVRPTCRHRQMLPAFLAADAIDQPMFWDFEGQAWYTLDEPAPADLCAASDQATSADEPSPAQPTLPFNLTLRDLTDTNALLAAAELEINRSEPAAKPTTVPSLASPSTFSQPAFKPRRI